PPVDRCRGAACGGAGWVRAWAMPMAQLIGISRGRRVIVTETPRKGSSASSVVIRNAVVPNQRTFQVPPRPRTASFISLASRAASRREYTKAAKYQAEKKAATTRTTTSLGSVSATAGEPHGATKGLGSCRKNLTGGRPSAKWGDGLNRASRLWKTGKAILWCLFVSDRYTANLKTRRPY